ncbi:hypothetical protein H114_00727 [Streptomyces gancidicus BKS 13-15]|uniref:Uncharacterized protein n=1 Tax=Streptomyces gancidicus BKS 13-15 TaxID=1284664 RepID=M3D3Z5_STREZ|nr:hypothetical protein [Streptomyces gancidicus]EMF31108.1 hypothetical protein H114_00727 [Streptomyces gancidicus BKS 13-15]
MTRRPRWNPPHPARTIRPPTTCPRGQRYRTRELAAATLAALGVRGGTDDGVHHCRLCGGWHTGAAA